MRDKPLILVVDDEENFLEIMETKLGASGFEVALAKNGVEGVSEAERLMPDLILMDINMPGSSGTDAALAIKQNPKTKEMKIAFITSMKDPWPSLQADKRAVAKAIGMEEFIDKTEDLEAVVEKIRTMLAKK